jgi:hypothetical protein
MGRDRRKWDREGKKTGKILVNSDKSQTKISNPRKQGSLPGKKLTSIGLIFPLKSLFKIIRDHVREFSPGLIERIRLRGKTQIKAESLPLAVLVLCIASENKVAWFQCHYPSWNTPYKTGSTRIKGDPEVLPILKDRIRERTRCHRINPSRCFLL